LMASVKEPAPLGFELITWANEVVE